MNKVDTEYFRIVNDILTNGKLKKNRTGVDCLTIAGAMFQHDMSEGFPLLTSRKMPFKSTKVELEFFIKGLRSKKWLQDRGCQYWNGWASPTKIPYSNDSMTKLRMEEEPDLGPVYGYQWRNFGRQYQPIPVIKTGFDKVASVDLTIPDSYLGKTFEGKYGKFIVEKVIKAGKKNTSPILQIMFLTTGFRNVVRKDCITNNKVKDYYFPNISNVACLGVYDKNNLSSNLFKNILSTWKSMVNRCYYKKNQNYKYYGEKGIYVDDRWLVFEYFVEDISKLENYCEKLANLSEYTIDRIDVDGPYTLKNCKWSSKKEQARNRRWRGTAQYKQTGVDQLQNIVDTLKSNPDDRRMICNAWNPLALNQMALPPCHYSWQVTVIDGYLNLAWNQRSVDIACNQTPVTYGLLLHLLAKEAGLKEGKLIGFLMDTHAYVTHIEGLKKQLTQETYSSPTIKTEKFTSIFDWSYGDTELVNYQSSGPIKFDVAV